MSLIGVVLGQLATLPAPRDVPAISVGDRTEARVRSRLFGSGAAFDVETLPFAALTWKRDRIDMLVAYGARIAELDIIDDPVFAVSHSGRLGAGWAFTRRFRLDVAGYGTIGKQVVEGLVVAPTLGATPTLTTTRFTPPVTVLDSVSYQAELRAGYRLSRVWDLGARATYTGGEGLDAPSRAYIPAYRGPGGQLSAGYTASRQDVFTSYLRAQYTESPSIGSHFFDAVALETWAHSWTLRTTGFAGLGVEWLLSRPNSASQDTRTFSPNGELGVTHTIPIRSGETVVFKAGTRFAVAYDPLLRVAEPTVGGAVSATWANAHFGTRGTADTTVAVPVTSTEPPARQVAGTVTGWYTPAPPLRFEVGARTYWQDLGAAVVPAGALRTNDVQWAAFIAVVVLAPPLDL